MSVSFSISGLADLQKRLSTLPDAVSFKVQQTALKAGAESIRAEAAALAPRSDKAPHLADNIVIGVPTRGLEDVNEGDAVVAVGPQKNFFYGFFQEYGTIHQAAQPFMRPAFDNQSRSALNVVAESMWLAIRKALPLNSFSGRSTTSVRL